MLTAGEREAIAGAAGALAMVFATKEAVLKALGCGLSQGWRWRDIEVCADGVRLSGVLRSLAVGKGVSRVRTARLCTNKYAFACVIVEGEPHAGGIQ